MPIDIRELRTDQGGDPERWREYQRKRFKDPAIVDRVLELDGEWRAVTTWLRDTRKALNSKQKALTKLFVKSRKAEKTGEDLTAEEKETLEAGQAELEALKAKIPLEEKRLADLAAARDKTLEGIGNEVHPSVPVSETEDDNRVEREVGGHPLPVLPDGGEPLHHHELLWMIGGYEPERGAAAAGSRGYFLTGPGTRLNIALIHYALDFLKKREYSAVQPPYFLNKDTMAQVAELDDYDEQLYHVTGHKDEAPKYLIATSEQPLCTFHRGDRIRGKDLPFRYAGWSTCFRKEAGSYGRDTWGIFRVHQFEKIEQFIICRPEDSWDMHEAMIKSAEDFYDSLGIPYRVLCLVSKELNNAAAKKYDLEGWFPGFKEYRELVSCSNCTDYQARAMECRLVAGHKGDAAKQFCHFLNSTLCATTRTICAILENYQTADGVRVPEALVPYMGGETFLPFVRKRPVDANAARLAREAKGKGKSKGGAGSKKTEPAAAAASSGAGGEPAKAKAATKAAAPKAKAAAPKAKAAAPKAKAGKPAVGSKPSLATADGLATLNKKLEATPYIASYTPSPEDEAAFALMAACPPATTFPHAARWFRHMATRAAAAAPATASKYFVA